VYQNMKIGHGWHPYVKSDGTLVIRTKGANRQSKRVKEINGKLSAAAAKCADVSLSKFRSCIAEAMIGAKASGTDAPGYTYAKAHRTQALRVSGMPRAKVFGKAA
jgi:hypothetical protein